MATIEDFFQIYSDHNDRNPTRRTNSSASFIPHLSKQYDKLRSWFYFKQEFITNIYNNGVDKAANVDQFCPLKSRYPLKTNLKAQLYQFSAITKRIVINIKILYANMKLKDASHVLMFEGEFIYKFPNLHRCFSKSHTRETLIPLFQRC